MAEVNVGWECPRCHACYAPHVAQCSECRPESPPLRERVSIPSIRLRQEPRSAEPVEPGWSQHMKSACTGFGLGDYIDHAVTTDPERAMEVILGRKPWINRAVPDDTPMG